MPESTKEDWSQFWLGSTVTTFQGLFGDNYSGDIASFWREHLQGGYSRVVDIACGNGALCWMAHEILNTEVPDLQIIGIDYADINPFKRLGKRKADYPQVSFLGHTPAEQLPFADGSVDLVVSQYGLEYSSLASSVAELGRVLSAAGKVCLVSHVSQSVLVQTEMRMLAACREILYEDRLHDLYLALDALMRRTTDDSALEIKQLKKEIAHVSFRVRNRVRDFRKKVDVENYLYRIEKVFAENTPRRSKKRQQEVELARDLLSTFVRRLEDLSAAALTPERQDWLIQLLQQQGLHVVEQRPLYIEAGVLWGQGLVAQRG